MFQGGPGVSSLQRWRESLEAVSLNISEMTRGSRGSPRALGSSPGSAPKCRVTLGQLGPLLTSVFLVSKMAMVTFVLLLSCGYHADQSIS